MKLWVAAAALAGSIPAAAEPLIVDHGRLFIDAKVNGVPTEALLDSAAEASLIDPKLAAAAGFPVGQPIQIRGSGGAATARFVSGVTLVALGLTLQGEGVVVLDLTDLSTRLIKRPTQVVIGRELFDAAPLRVDIARGSIEVIDPGATPPGRRLPLTTHAGVEAIPVSVNGTFASAEFDLGNGSEVLISRPLARRLKLPVRGRRAGGGIGGSVMRDSVTLRTLDVAGKRFRNVPATIDDQPNANDLNIGTSVLRSFLITTDFKQRAVWLAPAGGRSR